MRKLKKHTRKERVQPLPADLIEEKILAIKRGCKKGREFDETSRPFFLVNYWLKMKNRRKSILESHPRTGHHDVDVVGVAALITVQHV